MLKLVEVVEFHHIYFCCMDCAKAFDCIYHNKLKYSQRDLNTRPQYLPPEKLGGRARSNS